MKSYDVADIITVLVLYPHVKGQQMRTARVCSVLTLGTAIICLLSVMGTIAIAEGTAPPQAAPAPATGSAPPATQPKAAPPAQTNPPAVSAVTQAAVQAGVLKSASRINQVVGFLAGKNKSYAYLFTPQTQPDISIFSISLGIQEVTGQQRYASASFVPLANGVSAAVYDTVEYFDKPPAELEKGIFKNLKRKGVIGKDTIILDAGPVTVFIMPAGPGSVVIKKEVVQ